MRTALRRLLLATVLAVSLSACNGDPIICINPIGPGAGCVG